MKMRSIFSILSSFVLVFGNPAEYVVIDNLQDPQVAASENELQKIVTKKSVEDEEAIKAAEAYEFEYIPESSPDYESSIVEIEPLASATHEDHHHHHHDHSKVGYSVGGPLVNIAQGAARQTVNFEKNQPAAAAQAAYVAKNRLGQSAGLSAATAAAAFAGKQIILRGLEQQAYTAHRSLESEKLQLQQAQRAATAAGHAAQQAMHQVQVITTALNAAQATSQHASAAAAEAAAELAAQTAMVGAAKARLQAIEDQLHLARIDFHAAQAANFKAAHAAQVAQNNAAAAAAHAAEVANANHGHRHDNDHHHHHRHHHEHKHDHLEHHAKLETESSDDEDGDDDETHLVPATVSNSSAVAGAATTLTNIDGVLKSAANGIQDYTGVVATIASVSPDDNYDSYDSFPY